MAREAWELGIVTLLDMRNVGRRTRVVNVLLVNVSTGILSSASSPLITFLSCSSKYAHFSLATVINHSGKLNGQGNGLLSPQKKKKKTCLGDQASEWKPCRDMLFSMRHISYKVTSNDFTCRPRGHKEVLIDVANISATEAFLLNWPCDSI